MCVYVRFYKDLICYFYSDGMIALWDGMSNLIEFLRYNGSD